MIYLIVLSILSTFFQKMLVENGFDALILGDFEHLVLTKIVFFSHLPNFR